MKARLLAIAWGALIGGMTFAVGSVASLTSNPIVGAIQAGLMILMMPGLIGGATISGKIHAFNLGPCALINSLIHFGFAWLLFLWRHD